MLNPKGRKCPSSQNSAVKPKSCFSGLEAYSRHPPNRLVVPCRGHAFKHIRIRSMQALCLQMEGGSPPSLFFKPRKPALQRRSRHPFTHTQTHRHRHRERHTHTHTHTHTQTPTHARTHARTHSRTHAHPFQSACKMGGGCAPLATPGFCLALTCPILLYEKVHALKKLCIQTYTNPFQTRRASVQASVVFAKVGLHPPPPPPPPHPPDFLSCHEEDLQ